VYVRSMYVCVFVFWLFHVMCFIVISDVRFQYFELRFGFGSVVWKTAMSVRFGFILCFLLLSALSVSDSAYNEWLLMFNALQRWLSTCVTLVMLIRSLNYTFNRDTCHSYDDEINCNCVRKCFINIYRLSNRPKNTNFFVRVSFSNIMIFEWLFSE